MYGYIQPLVAFLPSGPAETGRYMDQRWQAPKKPDAPEMANPQSIDYFVTLSPQ